MGLGRDYTEIRGGFSRKFTETNRELGALLAGSVYYDIGFVGFEFGFAEHTAALKQLLRKDYETRQGLHGDTRRVFTEIHGD